MAAWGMMNPQLQRFVRIRNICFTAVGGLLALRFRDRLRILLGFSAGAMVALVLFDLLPSVFAYPGMGRQAMMATA